MENKIKSIFKKGTLGYVFEEEDAKKDNTIQDIQLHINPNLSKTMVRRLAPDKV